MSTHHQKPDVPLAPRARSAGWRDPRLWIGVALVAASVLIGARVLGSADEMTEVWALKADLAAGQQISSEDLEPTRVRFDDEQDARDYVLVRDGVPSDGVLQRSVGAGELLPAKAVGTQGEQLVEVPLTAPVENIPSTLRRGSRVDVYVIPERVGASDPDSTPTATKVLEDVAVIAVPEKDEVIGQVGSRQILVGVPAGADGEIGIVLAAARDNRVQLTKRG
ncbi:hypothetical protein BJ980_003247 [Nocardioides daedukensis]|uniref:SAF domain-containing protein n=1 Tax=Nocardioides daedukensis TaxID=634462 RepID=A0A7Y9S5W0_9ACTN|nr:hypothetical protein [Nocardioides daedukensis]NYG60324.1 hypothetical protein [Nocardioides daedukensis]